MELSLIHIWLGAGRGLCRVNHFGMALGGDFFLCNDDLFANGAVLALSGDTHTGAGMTAVIIVCCAGHDGLSILDQINACLLYTSRCV